MAEQKELLNNLLQDLQTQISDYIDTAEDGDFMRGQVNFFQITKSLIKDYIKNQTNEGWIPVSKRFPTTEEYIAHDGRFIADDGNRQYFTYYDRYNNRFIQERLDGFTEDKCIVAWHELPEKYKPEPTSEWHPNNEEPEEGTICICIHAFGTHMPFIGQFRKTNDVLPHGYMLNLNNITPDNTNPSETYTPDITMMPAIEKWKPFRMDEEDYLRVKETIALIEPQLNNL